MTVSAPRSSGRFSGLRPFTYTITPFGTTPFR